MKSEKKTHISAPTKGFHYFFLVLVLFYGRMYVTTLYTTEQFISKLVTIFDKLNDAEYTKQAASYY